jgi:predicted SAM-dependent methyltransferase
MRYANLGCGARHHPDWINIDIVPRGPGVIAHDLSEGVPLDSASCDVIYHAHVLEHLRRTDANRFMAECLRVLKPGGILRVATPDLERMAQLYLSSLSKSVAGGDSGDHEWITLEMFDQMVREESGGQMREFLRLDPLPSEAFVFARIGQEGREIVEVLRRHPDTPAAAAPLLRVRLAQALRHPVRAVRGKLFELLLNSHDRRALQIGRFRLAGEVHQWMYDRYSLAKLMTDAGFADPRPLTATSSLIAGWTAFNLDTQSDGTVIKPDSMYMEATRPPATGSAV